MDSFILTLAIRWLSAVDALSASCVSREWQEALSSRHQGGDVWKQVCLNTNPVVVKAMNSNENVNYRLLAIGLGRTIPRLPPKLKPPKLQANDLFAVIDLYRHQKLVNGKRRRVIEASWTCPVEWPTGSVVNIGMTSNNANEKVTIQGANPYAASHRNAKHVQQWARAQSLYSQKSPLHYAAYDVVGANCVPSRSLRVKVVLFRKDNFHSVCVLDEDISDVATGGDEDPAEEVVRFYYQSKDSLRFANNDAGQNARLLARKRVFTKLSLDGEFYLKAVLPEPNSDQEEKWLKNSRHAVRTLEEHELYHPTKEDQAALLKIPSFSYEVKRFAFTFRVTTNMPLDFWDEFDNEQDLLIALEGLGWQ